MTNAMRWGGFALVLALAGCSTAPVPGEAPAPAPKPSGAAAPVAAPASAPVAEPVPEHYSIDLDTSVGPIVIAVDRADAPIGADRLYHLVQAHYFDGARFFRVVPGFVVQFGLAADPALTKAWNHPIEDDPVKGSNTRGTVVFAATSEPNSRTAQLFINLADNSRLDGMGFAPVGRVTAGMDNVDRIYSGYGESPDQGKLQDEGNAYLARDYPSLDYIRTARIAP